MIKKLLLQLFYVALILNPIIAAAVSDSDRLFNYAEQTYPQHFSPSGAATFTIGSYLARYYSGTDTYIGTLGNDVYVYGNKFGGLMKVGQISDFITTQSSSIAGNWNVQEVVDSTNCGEGVYTINYTAIATVNGSEITVLANGVARTGTLNASGIKFNVSYPEDGGTTASTGTLTFNQSTFTGNSSWTWSGSGFKCSGTSEISASKI